MSNRKPSRPPNIGIIYFVGDKLWVAASPIEQAGNFGDFAFHERYHFQYWEQLVKRKALPDAEYDRYARGWVNYDRTRGKLKLVF